MMTISIIDEGSNAKEYYEYEDDESGPEEPVFTPTTEPKSNNSSVLFNKVHLEGIKSSLENNPWDTGTGTSSDQEQKNSTESVNLVHSKANSASRVSLNDHRDFVDEAEEVSESDEEGNVDKKRLTSKRRKVFSRTLL